MRRKHSISHHDHVGLVRPDFEVAKSKPRKRVSWWKLLISVLVIALVGIVAYVVYGAISSANNMLSSNINFRDLISRGSLKQTNGITNILILGKGGANHAGGQLTDTLMLARLRHSDDALAMVSVPRDLQVSIPGAGQRKINEAYSTGWNNEKDQNKKADSAAKMSSQVVGQTLDLTVHYYITVDFVGFKELVDNLGGVTVDVEQDLYDPNYPKDSFDKNGNLVETTAYTTVSVKKGVQTMNGDLALKYARSRETTSDFDRARRQQRLLVAIRDKALSLGVLTNPVKVNEVMNTLGSHIRTNLSVSEIKDFVNTLKSVDKNKIKNYVIDNGNSGLLVSSSEGYYHLTPKTGNFKEIQAYVRNVFETSSTTATPAKDIEIEVYNATATNGLAGQFADKLKADGLTVTKIETNEQLVDRSIVYDGTSNSPTAKKIESMFDSPEIMTNPDENVIKIIIGKDYGN